MSKDEKLREASYRARSASGRPEEWAQAFRDQQARKAAQEPAQGPRATPGHMGPFSVKERPLEASMAQQSGIPATIGRAMSVMQAAATEMDVAHAALDAHDVPTEDDRGQPLSLAMRIRRALEELDGYRNAADERMVTGGWADE